MRNKNSLNKIIIPILIAIFFIFSFSIILMMQLQINSQLAQINESINLIHKALGNETELVMLKENNNAYRITANINTPLKSAFNKKEADEMLTSLLIEGNREVFDNNLWEYFELSEQQNRLTDARSFKYDSYGNRFTSEWPEWVIDSVPEYPIAYFINLKQFL